MADKRTRDDLRMWSERAIRAEAAMGRLERAYADAIDVLREEAGTTFGCWCPGLDYGTTHDKGCKGPRVIYGPRTQALLAAVADHNPADSAPPSNPPAETGEPTGSKSSQSGGNA